MTMRRLRQKRGPSSMRVRSRHDLVERQRAEEVMVHARDQARRASCR